MFLHHAVRCCTDRCGATFRVMRVIPTECGDQEPGLFVGMLEATGARAVENLFCFEAT